MNELGVSKHLHVLLNRLLQIGVSEEFTAESGLQLLDGALWEVLLHEFGGGWGVEEQHPTPSVLDDDDLLGTKELLRNNDAAKRIGDAGAGVADYVGGAEGDAENGGWVEAGVHA